MCVEEEDATYLVYGKAVPSPTMRAIVVVITKFLNFTIKYKIARSFRLFRVATLIRIG